MTALFCTQENIKQQLIKAGLTQYLQVSYEITADECANRIKIMTTPEQSKRKRKVKAFKGNSVEDLAKKISKYMII